MELCHLNIEVITREPGSLLDAIKKLELAGNVRMMKGEWRKSACGPLCPINMPFSQEAGRGP